MAEMSSNQFGYIGDKTIWSHRLLAIDAHKILKFDPHSVWS